MQSIGYEFVLAAVAAVLVWSLTGLYCRAMTASQRLVPPNERSMHVVPVPAGAGLAIVAAVVVLWPAWHVGRMDRVQVVMLLCLVALAALSFVDDRRGLPPLVRLSAQFVAVALCLGTLAPDLRVFQVLPLGVERFVLALAWLWFINLFNFMDGIDGLAGSEALAIALGAVLVLLAAGMDFSPYWRLALIVAAASVGYLVWNWHPAKVMMGDAGSIPLGFVLGWLLIQLAVNRQWAAAAILPLYFVADATITLLSRLSRGQKPWQAHREHFYQRAVLGGTSPPGVVLRVTTGNVVLVMLALFSVHQPVLASLAAVVVVAALLAHLQRLAGAPPPAAEPAAPPS